MSARARCAVCETARHVVGMCGYTAVAEDGRTCYNLHCYSAAACVCRLLCNVFSQSVMLHRSSVFLNGLMCSSESIIYSFSWQIAVHSSRSRCWRDSVNCECRVSLLGVSLLGVPCFKLPSLHRILKAKTCYLCGDTVIWFRYGSCL